MKNEFETKKIINKIDEIKSKLMNELNDKTVGDILLFTLITAEINVKIEEISIIEKNKLWDLIETAIQKITVELDDKDKKMANAVKMACYQFECVIKLNILENC